MKQIKISLIAGLASFFLLVSCQKEFTIEGGITPIAPGTNDSVYLDRVIEVYTALMDSTIQNFRYDNQKRVVGISRKLYRNNMLEDTSVATFFYNGSDTLPFKYTDYAANMTVSYFDSVVAFLYYDAQGRVVSDSTIYAYGGPFTGYSKDKDIGNYQYVGNNIYRYRTQTDLVTPSPVINYLDTFWLDANKNIVKWHAYDSPPLFLFYTEDATFDNKVNPYYYMNFSDHPNRNNMLTSLAEKIFSPGSSSIYNTSYVHVYNSFNMPTQTIGTETGTVSERKYYKYRSL